jgi:HEPN domain-containing protein
MYNGTYAPWENAPKLLRHDEMMEPLKVVIDFFEIDAVSGHDERFKEWRDYAVRSDHYNNARSGPGALLYVWEENVKLIEAMFLLWHQQRKKWNYKPATDQMIAQEKLVWDYFPANLSDKQIANPYTVIEKVFNNFSLAVYRDHLYEWLNMALTKTENRDPIIDAEEVITIYENMLELHAAAWIICQRNSPRPHLKCKKQVTLKSNNIHSEQEIAPHQQEATVQLTVSADNLLKPLYPKPSPAEILGLQKIKEVILERYATVQMIIFLGSYAEPFTYFLLLLVSDEEKKEEGQLSCDIEGQLQYLTHTHIILHKTASAICGIKDGKRFWNQAIGKGFVVYQKAGVELPATQVISGAILEARAKFHWDCWGKQGEALLKGAEFYFNNGNYRLAAFTLHKATEAILKAIIQSVTGYRIQMHNVSRLLRLTLLFTSELKKVFELDTKDGAQGFMFLKNAYAQAHYSAKFNPDKETIHALLEKITALYHSAERIQQNLVAQLQENNIR